MHGRPFALRCEPPIFCTNESALRASREDELSLGFAMWKLATKTGQLSAGRAATKLSPQGCTHKERPVRVFT